MFSFQAIKHITTADGGMLCIKNKKLLKKAKRIRWFGIDREKNRKLLGKMIFLKLDINIK